MIMTSPRPAGSRYNLIPTWGKYSGAFDYLNRSGWALRLYYHLNTLGQETLAKQSFYAK